MIAVQDWLAPLIGSLVLVVVPLIIAAMCNTIVNRLRASDLRAHEHRLDRSILPNRKDDERARLKVAEEWNRIEAYTRGRNLCLLISLGVVEANVGLILLVVTANSPILTVSTIVVLVILFAAVFFRLLKKPKRPIWATTPGYYRDLAVGNPSRGEGEPA